METTFNIARYIPLLYMFNPETGHFQKSACQLSAIPCNIMPYELRREKTQADQIKCNASECLTMRDKKQNGSRKLLTGLQSLPFENWYIGNQFNPAGKKNKQSDILFYFPPSADRMYAFYFSGYHSATKEMRERFAARHIPILAGEYQL